LQELFQILHFSLGETSFRPGFYLGSVFRSVLNNYSLWLTDFPRSLYTRIKYSRAEDKIWTVRSERRSRGTGSWFKYLQSIFSIPAAENTHSAAGMVVRSVFLSGDMLMACNHFGSGFTCLTMVIRIRMKGCSYKSLVLVGRGIAWIIRRNRHPFQ